MKKDPLFELGRQKLLDLRSQLTTVKTSIATLKADGLIAAKGTAIASYKAQGAGGNYYDYYKLIKGKNETLIHLGREDSQWVEFFRSALERRSLLDELEKKRSQLTKEISELEIAISL